MAASLGSTSTGNSTQLPTSTPVVSSQPLTNPERAELERL